MESVTCPSCGRTVRPGLPFCSGCGADLGLLSPPAQATRFTHPRATARSRPCKSCGAPLSPVSYWCHACGADLRPVLRRLSRSALVALACLLILPAVGYWLWISRDITSDSLLPLVEGQLAARVPDGIAIRDLGPGVHIASQDHSVVAYLGQRGAETCLLLNSSIVHCGSGLSMPRLNFNGSVWACTANAESGAGSRVIHNGSPSPVYSQLKYLALSPARGRVAYAGLRDDGWHAVCDGSPGPAYDDVEDVDIDDGLCVYSARKENRWFVVANGVPGPPFDLISELTLAYSKGHWAYAGRDGRSFHLVVDGKVTGSYRAVRSIKYSHPPDHLAAAVLDGSGWRVFLDGSLSPPGFPEITTVEPLSSGQVRIYGFDPSRSRRVFFGNPVQGFLRSRGSEALLSAAREPFGWSHHHPLVLARTQGLNHERAILSLAGNELRWRIADPPESTLFTAADESWADPDLRSVRDRLIESLQAKSVSGILAHASPDIRAGFGTECCGHQALIDSWSLQDPKSRFWEVALAALKGGGLWRTSDGVTEFVAPASASYPYSDIAPLFAAPPEPIGGVSLITAQGVSLLSQPQSNAMPIAVLQPQAVGVLQTLPEGWVKVVTVTGTQGWVQARSFSHALSPRAYFAKLNGVWKLTAFVQGD